MNFDESVKFLKISWDFLHHPFFSSLVQKFKILTSLSKSKKISKFLRNLFLENFLMLNWTNIQKIEQKHPSQVYFNLKLLQ